VDKRRLFLALGVDETRAEEWAAAFCEALVRCAGVHHAGRLRFVPSGEWHLTLCFLGMTPADRIADLADAVLTRVAACRVPRVVELCGGVFLERGAARVLWFGPREAGEAVGRLEALATAARDAVDHALPGSLPAGERSASGFRAHLTGARVRRGERGPSREALRAFADEHLTCNWQPAEVRLYESRTGGNGPRYTVLERFPVGTTPDADEKSPGPQGPAAG